MDALPLELSSCEPPSHMGAFVFSCVGVQHSEAELLGELLPHVAMGGGRMQGEFGSPTGGPARLHSYASNIALLLPWAEGEEQLQPGHERC